MALYAMEGCEGTPENLWELGLERMKSQNFALSLVSAIASPTANQEFAVTHDLHTVPIDAFIARTYINARLYKGTTAWTNTTAYFKSDTPLGRFIIAFFR